MISIFAGYNLVTCGLREETGKVSTYYVPALDLARCFPHMAECLKVALVTVVEIVLRQCWKRYKKSENLSFNF